jgi:hypothetical protein
MVVVVVMAVVDRMILAMIMNTLISNLRCAMHSSQGRMRMGMMMIMDNDDNDDDDDRGTNE